MDELTEFYTLPRDTKGHGSLANAGHVGWLPPSTGPAVRPPLLSTFSPEAPAGDPSHFLFWRGKEGAFVLSIIASFHDRYLQVSETTFKN